VVLLAVVRNYGIPLGSVLAPSEQAVSYELFYRSMMDVDDELAKLEPSVEAEGTL
jgi:hypothetical protein